MPDPQVSAAAGWSALGQFMTRRGLMQGAAPAMPSLGYALPNSLPALVERGLGKTRAAQALRRHQSHQRLAISDQLSSLALPNASAAPAAFDASAKRLLLEAALSEFDQINQRLEAIAKIEDPESQRAKLAAVLADLDKLQQSLDHDPAVAQAIYKILAAGTANGIADAAAARQQALANWNPNQRRDSLGLWVDANGGGLSVAANLKRGQNAMDRALRQRADVRKAMHRKEVGQIDFEWGRPGTPHPDAQGRTHADGYGISHIAAKHGEKAARDLPEVLAKGKITPHDRPERRYVTHGNYRAVLERHNRRNAYVVTGFDEVAR
jgi:hypothetical protein